MSLDNAQANGSPAVEDAPAAEPAAPGRSASLWFLVVPIAIALAVAAIAFFLLSPRDEDLLTTADPEAVAVAVQSARPASPAFTSDEATTQTTAAAEADPSDLNATNSAP